MGILGFRGYRDSRRICQLFFTLSQFLSKLERKKPIFVTLPFYQFGAAREEETVEHLFFRCEFAENCLIKVKCWLDWKAGTNDLNKLVWWIQRSRMTLFKKQIVTASLAGLIYWLWSSRNRRLWQNVNTTVEEILTNVKSTVKYRVILLGGKKKGTSDYGWFLNL